MLECNCETALESFLTDRAKSIRCDDPWLITRFITAESFLINPAMVGPFFLCQWNHVGALQVDEITSLHYLP